MNECDAFLAPDCCLHCQSGVEEATRGLLANFMLQRTSHMQQAVIWATIEKQSHREGHRMYTVTGYMANMCMLGNMGATK